MKAQKLWYVVCTRPRWEKKVSALLDRQAIENYCPVNRLIRQWSDRRKTVYEPLFSCYVFVNIAPGDRSAVQRTEGIVRFVEREGRPATIRPDEMHELRVFMEEHEYVQAERAAIDPNERIRVLRGMTRSGQGAGPIVMHHSIRLVLPTLGFVVTARLKPDDTPVTSQLTTAGILAEELHLHPKS